MKFLGRKQSTRLCSRAATWPGIFLFLFLASAFAQAQPTPRYDIADLSALQQAFVELADDIRPSVAAIRTYRALDVGEEDGGLVKIPLSQGSAFVIDSEGLLATNRHVVEGADIISVRLFDGTSCTATLVKDDARSDIAVIKTEITGLKPVRWGDADTIRVNQWAFACGNPFGLANGDGQGSVTVGVVSAMGREMTHRLARDGNEEYYGNLIETSASINPGNSGGPLFDLHGQVIGIVTAIETSSGVSEGRGFAIPIDRNTRRIIATLRAGEAVRYGFLGVSVAEVDENPEGSFVKVQPRGGAKIASIELPDGPAAKAGLRPKDVVIEYNGIPIKNSDDLVRLVGFTPVGADAVVTYLRSGVKHQATVTIGDRGTLLQAVRSTEP